MEMSALYAVDLASALHDSCVAQVLEAVDKEFKESLASYINKHVFLSYTLKDFVVIPYEFDKSRCSVSVGYVDGGASTLLKAKTQTFMIPADEDGWR